MAKQQIARVVYRNVPRVIQLSYLDIPVWDIKKKKLLGYAERNVYSDASKVAGNKPVRFIARSNVWAVY
jgi:hypothetical protein